MMIVDRIGLMALLCTHYSILSLILQFRAKAPAFSMISRCVWCAISGTVGKFEPHSYTHFAGLFYYQCNVFGRLCCSEFVV